MTEREHESSPAAKRRKLDRGSLPVVGAKPISPPPARRVRSRTPTPSTPRIEANVQQFKREAQKVTAEASATITNPPENTTTTTSYVASPFQLTKIQDLAPHQNMDTVSLHDILGDPMIKECWNFNFLFDIDFVMKHFDSDVRDSVKIKIVHGFWKREDERRIVLMEAAEPYANVELKTAYIPDPFGTHHSKMLILFRHDDLAQVIIHTANMIPRDWKNMTQAVWRSPLLPFLEVKSSLAKSQADSHPIGSGERFKKDLLRYLDKYENRLKALTQQLAAYDFTSIHAAFLSSAPSHQKPESLDPTKVTSFGWLGLQEILSIVTIQSTGVTAPSRIVTQVSSIATLGQNPAWLAHFQSVLHYHDGDQHKNKRPKPLLNVIFPTPDEIRTSLDGYQSGASIHTKIQSPAQQKQLAYLRPHLCHWKSNIDASSTKKAPVNLIPRQEAHRGPAAPHIKTYIRFSDAATMQAIDWAMVTSANLSKQAWGEMVNKKGEVWIQSWEVGVVVWPALFAEEGGKASMVPVFGRDMPAAGDELAVEQEPGRADKQHEETEDEETEDEEPSAGGSAMEGTKTKLAGSSDPERAHRRVVVGLRMPYDLPLSPYQADEVPWCATLAHTQRDWMGRAWAGR